MGINYRKKLLLREEILKKCTSCKIVYPSDKNFCPKCGAKLHSEKTKVFANIGKNGISSISYKLPDGTTINSKGNVTIPLGNGISYTSKSKTKK